MGQERIRLGDALKKAIEDSRLKGFLDDEIAGWVRSGKSLKEKHIAADKRAIREKAERMDDTERMLLKAEVNRLNLQVEKLEGLIDEERRISRRWQNLYTYGTDDPDFEKNSRG